MPENVPKGGADALEIEQGLKRTMARKEYPEAVRDIRYINEAAVVKLTGEIDMSHSPGVHQSLVEVLEARPARLIIDLADVSYMDSSGVGILVDALRRVRVSGATLALVGVTPRVLSVLQITKLDQFFEMYETMDEALVR
jgi:anti-sigma B factor antagonist